MGRSITAVEGVRGLALDNGLVLKAGETAIVNDEEWARISSLAPVTITDNGASILPTTKGPDGSDASKVPYSPSGNLGANDVEAALDELEAEKHPAIYERRGTGSPEGVVTAPTGTYYTDTAGTNGAWRWLKASGAGNTGWEVIHGDTGWRAVNVTGASVTGTLLIRRVNANVYVLQGTSAVGGSALTNGQTVYTLPVGFRPPSEVWAKYGVGTGEPTTFLAILNTGAINTWNAPVSVSQMFRVAVPPFTVGTTQGWPSSLPGSAA